MKQSDFLKVNGRDLLSSALTAILAAVLYWAQNELVPILNLSPEIKVLISGGIASIIRRFFTPKDKELK